MMGLLTTPESEAEHGESNERSGSVRLTLEVASAAMIVGAKGRNHNRFLRLNFFPDRLLVRGCGGGFCHAANYLVATTRGFFR
jgi:hypothetical protein